MAKETVNLSEINFDDLLERKSLYAIFVQSESDLKPINCRYVGETANLRERTNTHFSINESNDCLKEFMQSPKTKLMIYELLPNSTKENRLEKENEWIKIYNPKCNK